MFKAVRENIELRKEIQEQDRQYNLLLTKLGNLERENNLLKIENENLIKSKDKYLKRIREMRKELKELKNEKNN